MKFTVTMKDPDTLSDAIADAAKESVAGIPDLSDDERLVLRQERHFAFSKIAAAWFEYGEYLSVQIDTDAKTIEVLRVKP